jgi:hypothetical protein
MCASEKEAFACTSRRPSFFVAEYSSTVVAQRRQPRRDGARVSVDEHGPVRTSAAARTRGSSGCPPPRCPPARMGGRQRCRGRSGYLRVDRPAECQRARIVERTKRFDLGASLASSSTAVTAKRTTHTRARAAVLAPTKVSCNG